MIRDTDKPMEQELEKLTDWQREEERKEQIGKGKGAREKGARQLEDGDPRARGEGVTESTPIDSVPVLGNKRMTAAGVGKQQQQKRKDRLGQLVRGK